jgi:predicted RNase H-like HicB family nuclease
MDITHARSALDRFMGAHEQLTFSLETHENGEWVARCNEIPALITAGDTTDPALIQATIKDAILTAAGIDGSFGDEILRDAAIQQTVVLSR